jgi:hypothetical protein
MVIAICLLTFAAIMYVAGKIGEAIGSVINALVFAPRLLKMQQETIEHNRRMEYLDMQYQLLQREMGNTK